MKKVLVTGADGFIGSHLTESLLERGYDVRAFVYYNSFNTWGWLDTLPKEKLDQIEIFAGDVRLSLIHICQKTVIIRTAEYRNCEKKHCCKARYQRGRDFVGREYYDKTSRYRNKSHDVGEGNRAESM